VIEDYGENCEASQDVEAGHMPGQHASGRSAAG
jgi:hypothetical protein